MGITWETSPASHSRPTHIARRGAAGLEEMEIKPGVPRTLWGRGATIW